MLTLGTEKHVLERVRCSKEVVIKVTPVERDESIAVDFQIP